MSSKQLKILALISMFFDHFTRIFPMEDAIAPIADWLSSIGQSTLGVWSMEWIPYLLSYFGRVAAPVFMFCIVEGFVHTRNIKKYILRILGVALLAQIPYILFDLVQNRMYGISGDWKEVPLNILFTLGLGLISLLGYRTCKEKGYGMLGIGIVLLASLLARFLRFEGSEGYILIIFTFYAVRNQPALRKAFIFIPVLMLARYRLIAYTFEEFALLRTCLLNLIGPYFGILSICFYSGEKGDSGKSFQRFMYAFYPTHLLLLASIGYFIIK